MKRMLALLVFVMTGAALTPIATRAATTPGPGYLTIQFGRSIAGSYTGAQSACTPAPGPGGVGPTGTMLTLPAIAEDLQARGMIGTSTVVVNRTGGAAEGCYQSDIYADWPDLQSLNATYGWQVVSGGQAYSDMVTMTPAQQTAESCGTLQTFTAEGFNDAWGLFAYPNNQSTAAMQSTIVAPCFAYGRLYGTTKNYGTAINNRATMNPNGYQLTTNVLGGECNDSTQTCYSINTAKGTHYESPVALAALVASEGADQWLDLQFYRLVTGSSNDGPNNSWDCTSANWQEHWTSTVETYCASDFDQILTAVPAATVTADPAAVATAWGRIPMPPPPPVAKLAVSTYFGGAGNDQGYMVAAAPDGGVYTTGYLGGTGGVTSGFVVEYSPSGVVDWDTTIAGSGSVTPYYVRADSGGVYVVGVTTDRNLPAATNVDPVTGSTAFITVLSPTTGAVQTSTYLGGIGFSAANVDAIDPTSGDVYVGLSTGTQTVVEQLDPTGTRVLRSTLLGGAGYSTHPYGMQADAHGDVVVATLTASPIYPVINAAQGTYGGGMDTGVTEYSPAGAILWSTYYGGSAEDRPNGVDVDPAGNVYIAGTTWSTNLPLLNPLYSTNTATNAGYVAEFSHTGMLQYSTYLGGENGATYLGGVAVASDGTAWVVGGSTDSALPVRGGGSGYTKKVGGSAYIAAVEPNDAALSFATYLGGSGTDGSSSPALSSAGLWVIGRTNSTNFPTVNPAQAADAGGFDATVSLFTS